MDLSNTNITQSQKREGITLIGVMISLSIMTTGLVALLTLVNSTLLAAFSVRNNIEATSLLYDAFETIRNIRDSNLLSKDAETSGYEVWDNGFESNGSYIISCSASLGCEITKIANYTSKIEPTEAYAEFQLFQNITNGIINHDPNGAESIDYYRQIIVEDPCVDKDPHPIECSNRSANPNLKQVSVYITWIDRGVTREIEGHTYIGNWNVDDI